MSNDEFTKLFNHMNERFDDVKLDGKETRAEIRQILSQLDSMLKRLEISDDERLVMGYQLDRLDRWVKEVANKIGHKLTAY